MKLNYIDKIHRLIEQSQLVHAERLAIAASRWFPSDPRYQRLLGLLYGMSQRHADAQRAFANAYELGKSEVDLANSITAFFAMGDRKRA